MARPDFSIRTYFADLQDPRLERTRHHNLMDIVAIAICAVICGADGWLDMEAYGIAKYDWLKTFLQLPNGIPSHDRMARTLGISLFLQTLSRLPAWFR